MEGETESNQDELFAIHSIAEADFTRSRSRNFWILPGRGLGQHAEDHARGRLEARERARQCSMISARWRSRPA